MVYITAKTDWTVPDIVNTTDMNNIGTNLDTNRLGGGETSVPSFSIANDLTLDLVHNFFLITGTPSTAINRIEYSDGSTTRENGNIITLVFSIDAIINVSGTANNSTHIGIIQHDYLTQINVYGGDALQFILIDNGTKLCWYPIHIYVP